MWHTLLHIYGPISIHGYGFMIALGLLLFLYLVQKDWRFKELKLESHFTAIVLIGTFAGLVGGRIFFFISHPEYYKKFIDLFTFFKGGFSILGCVLAILITLPFYLRYLHIPIIPLLDLIALYAPLLQAVSRIGCFFAGCCYGIPTTAPWGVVYTDQDSVAPLYLCLHPTQLYSAIGLLLIFALLYFVFQYRFRKKGQLVCLYIALMSFERFAVEFWRGDRVDNQLLSLNQFVAIGMFFMALVGLGAIQLMSKNEHL